MPELPEVETTRLGIEPHLNGKTIDNMTIWQPSLRWPIPDNLPALVRNQRIQAISRRGKYILFHLNQNGGFLIHLGMSGSLRIITELPSNELRRKHDHWQLNCGNIYLRYNDPRRFGSLLHADDPDQHPLLTKLGPEPMDNIFDGDFLYRLSRGKQSAVKSFIMDSHVVVGVGNIYAAESLFKAGIHPNRAAGKISLKRYRQLAIEIKKVIEYALQRGGTTLRDYVNSDGNTGYFQLELMAYGRENQPCTRCDSPMKNIRLNQRASVYCPKCQT